MRFLSRVKKPQPIILVLDDHFNELGTAKIDAEFAGYDAKSVLVSEESELPPNVDAALNDLNVIPELLECFKPVAIYTDMAMGKFTAPQVIKAIRSVDGYQSIPVLIHSTVDSDIIEGEVKSAKLVDVSVVNKSAESEDILSALSKMKVRAKGMGFAEKG
jgi:hypothetical protein